MALYTFGSEFKPAFPINSLRPGKFSHYFSPKFWPKTVAVGGNHISRVIQNIPLSQISSYLTDREVEGAGNSHVLFGRVIFLNPISTDPNRGIQKLIVTSGIKSGVQTISDTATYTVITQPPQNSFNDTGTEIKNWTYTQGCGKDAFFKIRVEGYEIYGPTWTIGFYDPLTLEKLEEWETGSDQGDPEYAEWLWEWNLDLPGDMPCFLDPQRANLTGVYAVFGGGDSIEPSLIASVPDIDDSGL